MANGSIVSLAGCAFVGLFVLWCTFTDIYERLDEIDKRPKTIIIEEVLMIKDGASVLGMKEEILLAYTVAMDVYRSNYNVPAVLTEGTGGKHGAHTHHKKGMAMDLRVRNVDPMFHQDLTNKLKEALGREYQVVYETDHIHVEYDPT